MFKKYCISGFGIIISCYVLNITFVKAQEMEEVPLSQGVQEILSTPLLTPLLYDGDMYNLGHNIYEDKKRAYIDPVVPAFTLITQNLPAGDVCADVTLTDIEWVFQHSTIGRNYYYLLNAILEEENKKIKKVDIEREFVPACERINQCLGIEKTADRVDPCVDYVENQFIQFASLIKRWKNLPEINEFDAIFINGDDDDASFDLLIDIQTIRGLRFDLSAPAPTVKLYDTSPHVSQGENTQTSTDRGSMSVNASMCGFNDVFCISRATYNMPVRGSVLQSDTDVSSIYEIVSEILVAVQNMRFSGDLLPRKISIEFLDSTIDDFQIADVGSVRTHVIVGGTENSSLYEHDPDFVAEKQERDMKTIRDLSPALTFPAERDRYTLLRDHDSDSMQLGGVGWRRDSQATQNAYVLQTGLNRSAAQEKLIDANSLLLAHTMTQLIHDFTELNISMWGLTNDYIGETSLSAEALHNNIKNGR